MAFGRLLGPFSDTHGVLDFGILSAVQFYVAKALGKRDLDAANRNISTAFFTFAGIGVHFSDYSGPRRLGGAVCEGQLGGRNFSRGPLNYGVGLCDRVPGAALFSGAMCAHMRWDLVSQFGLVALLL